MIEIGQELLFVHDWVDGALADDAGFGHFLEGEGRLGLGGLDAPDLAEAAAPDHALEVETLLRNSYTHKEGETWAGRAWSAVARGPELARVSPPAAASLSAVTNLCARPIRAGGKWAWQRACGSTWSSLPLVAFQVVLIDLKISLPLKLSFSGSALKLQLPILLFYINLITNIHSGWAFLFSSMILFTSATLFCLFKVAFLISTRQ